MSRESETSKRAFAPGRGVRRKQRGASVVEYAILTGLISIVSIATVSGLGLTVNNTFEDTNDTLAHLNEGGDLEVRIAQPYLLREHATTVFMEVSGARKTNVDYAAADTSGERIEGQNEAPASTFSAGPVDLSALRPGPIDLAVSDGDRQASTQVELIDIGQFPDIEDAEPGQTLTSAPIQITGSTRAFPVEIPGGTRLLADGADATHQSEVLGGQDLALKGPAPAAFAQASTYTLSVAGGERQWTIKTRAVDHSPDPFALVSEEGTPDPLEVSQEALSEIITLTGFDGPLPFEISGDPDGAIIMDNTAYGTLVNLMPGDSLQVRGHAADEEGATREIVATLGDYTTSWMLESGAPDGSPDPFTLIALHDQDAQPQWDISNDVTVSGVDIPVQASISGDGNPYIRIVETGEFTQDPVMLENGDVIHVYMFRTTEYSSSHTSTLVIGDVSADFVVSTREADTTPDAFAFTPQENIQPTAEAISNIVTLSGYDGRLPATIATSGEASMRVNGGIWSSTANVQAGDAVELRIENATQYGQAYVATLDVGGVSGDFRVTTSSTDTIPDAYDIPSKYNQSRNALVASSATVTGFGGTLAATVSGEGSPELSLDGTNWSASVDITAGQDIHVRLMSSDQLGTSRTATVSIGGVEDDYVVKTRNPDQDPDGFGSHNYYDAAPSEWFVTEEFTVTGIDAGYSVNISGYGDTLSEFSLNGGPWQSSLAAYLNDKVVIRIMASDEFDTSVRQGIFVSGRDGNRGGNFYVRTRDASYDPDPVFITPVTGAAPSSEVVSEELSLSGNDYAIPVRVSGGDPGSPRVQVNGGPWDTRVDVGPGDVFRVKLTSSATSGSEVVAEVDIGYSSMGGETASFSVTTQ